MAKVRLTAGRIRDFSCPPGKYQAFLWDSDSPGLAVRATAKGDKAFIFQASFNGQRPRITIGSVDSWDIEKARTEARHKQTLIDQGIDPRLAKAKELQASESERRERDRQELIFNDVWKIYLEDQHGHATRGLCRDF